MKRTINEGTPLETITIIRRRLSELYKMVNLAKVHRRNEKNNIE